MLKYGKPCFKGMANSGIWLRFPYSFDLHICANFFKAVIFHLCAWKSSRIWDPTSVFLTQAVCFHPSPSYRKHVLHWFTNLVDWFSSTLSDINSILYLSSYDWPNYVYSKCDLINFPTKYIHEVFNKYVKSMFCLLNHLPLKWSVCLEKYCL